MRLPEIEIIRASRWSTPDDATESRPRFVTRYELELCIDGGGCSYVDEESSPLEPGVVIFARPGQIRHSRFPFTNDFVYFESESHDRELDSLLTCIPTFSRPKIEVISRFSAMIEAVPVDRMLATVRLLELLCLMKCEKMTDPKRRLRIGQAEIYASIRFMKENLSRKLSVSEMAAVAGYSPPHFTARFVELTGQSPYEYFTSLRLREAKRLLLCESVSVARIAESLGFGSASHFCSLFRQSFGLTPTEFARTGRMSEYEMG